MFNYRTSLLTPRRNPPKRADIPEPCPPRRGKTRGCRSISNAWRRPRNAPTRPTGATTPAWCRRKELEPLPPDPQVVGLYLAASASQTPAAGQKPSAVRTIERRLSAIAWNCAQHGQPLDRADRHIAEVMSGIRRRHARPPDQKEAVLAEDLLRMAATLAHGLRGLRDRAILLIGFAGGLRRSERRRGCNNKASCGQRARSA